MVVLVVIYSFFHLRFLRFLTRSNPNHTWIMDRALKSLPLLIGRQTSNFRIIFPQHPSNNASPIHSTKFFAYVISLTDLPFTNHPIQLLPFSGKSLIMKRYFFPMDRRVGTLVSEYPTMSSAFRPCRVPIVVAECWPFSEHMGVAQIVSTRSPEGQTCQR